MEFHEKLQQLRKQKGQTQEELAAALYVSRTAVSKWESGRGYPNIDSLKMIAAYFGLSIDELLSGEELLTIAQEDQRCTEDNLRERVFGLLDLSVAVVAFLPFFGQKADGVAQAVSLLSLTHISPWLKTAYAALVLSTAVWGALMLALQGGRKTGQMGRKGTVSLCLNMAGILLFTLGRQPYAAVFLLLFLTVKGLLLLKRR